MAATIRNTEAFGRHLRSIREQSLDVSLDALAAAGGPSATRQGEIERGADTEITGDLINKYETGYNKLNPRQFPALETDSFLMALATAARFDREDVGSQREANRRKLAALRVNAINLRPQKLTDLVVGVDLFDGTAVHAHAICAPGAWPVPSDADVDGVLDARQSLRDDEGTYWRIMAHNGPHPFHDVAISLATAHTAITVYDQRRELADRAEDDWSKYAGCQAYRNAQGRIDPMAGISSFAQARNRALRLFPGRDETTFALAWAILLANAIATVDGQSPYTAWLEAEDDRIGRERDEAITQLPSRLRADVPSVERLRQAVDVHCGTFSIDDGASDEWDISFTEGHPLQTGVQWAAPKTDDARDTPINPKPGDLLLHNGASRLPDVLSDMGHSIIEMTENYLILDGITGAALSAVRWYPFVDDLNLGTDLALIARHGTWQAVQLF